MIENNKKFI